MTRPIPGTAVALVGLVALGCGGAAGAAGPSQGPESAFRSIGSSRIPEPAPPPRAGYSGAHTAYYADGQPRSHGAYARDGERSVPHGMWTFWLADGSRRSQGRFHLGVPVGCFAIWSHGHRVTGVAQQGSLQPAACEPPPHEAADILESSHGGAAHPAVDIGFETLVAPWAELGARADDYLSSDPEMVWAVAALWRRRVGDLRFGGVLGWRAGQYDYFAVPVGVVGGWGRQLRPWIGIDLRGELGALILSARPLLNRSAVGAEYFWTPLAAVQADATWQLGGRFELITGVRAELALPREVDRTTRFCSFACGAQTATWNLGGFTPALVLGLRFLVW